MASAQATQALVDRVYGQSTPISSVDPEVAKALSIAAAPITPALMAKFESCLSQTVCQTGYPGAKLVIGLPIDDTANLINRQGQAISLLQALRYPNVKTILLPNGSGNAQTINSNFRSLLSQNANAIIGNFGNGATMAAVGRQAQQQGVVVSALNQNIAGESPGKNYIFTGNDLCEYGKYQAQAAVEGSGKSSGGSYTLMTGTPGNPYGAAWQPCTQKYLNAKGWSQAGSYTTNWTPQGTAQAVSAIISSGKHTNAILYDADCTQLVQSYESSGKPLPVIVGAGVAPSCVALWNKAVKAGKPFPAFSGNAQVWNYNVGVSAALDRLAGHQVSSSIPLHLKLIPFANMVKLEPQWQSYPASALFQSTLPLAVTKKLLGGA
jgi:ABC-type sugar transport system substrate-binding protein